MKKALILLVVLVLLAGLLFGLYHFLWTADNFAVLGEKAMAAGNYSRAVDRYTRAVSLAPDNVEYVLALADAAWLTAATRARSARLWKPSARPPRSSSTAV